MSQPPDSGGYSPQPGGYGQPPGGYGPPPGGSPPGGSPPGGSPPGGGQPGGYGPAPGGYGQPGAGYGQPSAGYGQPSAGYGQPGAGYGAPPGAAPPAGGMPVPTPAYPGGPVYAQPGPPPGMYLDAASGLLLPQGTVLASCGRRIGAYFMGALLAFVTLGIGYIIWGLIVWGEGTTPGLQVLGMRCWRPEEGRVANWGTMALREIIGRIVDGIGSIITEGLSFVFFLTRPDRKTLHDMIGGTVVLHDPNGVLKSS
jgi:uncharacterized RDD family membrane protein YckC